MDWKEKIGLVIGGVSGAMTLVFGLFPSDAVELFDLLIPNTGYYAVRIMSGIFAACVVVALICGAYHLVYKRLFKRFKAEVVGEPFRLGGNACLKASYTGRLEKGFFTCVIHPPEGETLPTKEKTHQWWPAGDTLQRIGTRDVGILNGSKKHESTWKPKIPMNYPIGTYRVSVGVYESTDSDNKPVTPEKKMSFHVVGRFSGTHPVSTTMG